MEKYTELGKIEVSDIVIARVVKANLLKESNSGIFACSKDLRIINDRNEHISSKELLSNLKIECKDNFLKISINVIVKFGISIEHKINAFMKDVADDICDLFPDQKLEICTHVCGIVSKKIAPRDLEYYLDYEP